MLALSPDLKPPAPNWTPKETFSPSALAVAHACLLKWAWGWLLGIWQIKKNQSTILGTLIHLCVQAYLKGGTVYDFEREVQPKDQREFDTIDSDKLAKLKAEAPRRALAGLHLLPRLGDPGVEEIRIEEPLQLDTAAILPYIPWDVPPGTTPRSFVNDPIQIVGRKDLLVKYRGVWYLIDHKSTRGKDGDPWAYVKTEAELREDPQVVLYAMEVMQRHGLSELVIRWVYYCTSEKEHPKAIAVDVLLHRTEVEEATKQWLLKADVLRSYVRYSRVQKPDLSQWPGPKVLPPSKESPCEQFGGCPYRADKGGPCRVPMKNLGAMIANAPQLKGKTEMNMPQLPPAPEGHTWQVNKDGSVSCVPLDTVPPANAPAAAAAPAAVPTAPVVHAPAMPAPGMPLQPPEAAQVPLVATEAAAAPVAAPVAPAEEQKPKRGRGRPKKGDETASTEAAAAPAAPSNLPEQILSVANFMKANGIKEVRFHANKELAGVTIA